MSEVTDITIIGGGPTGLFAAFYAGMRGRSALIIDSLPELGGQLTALYPEKYIFDVGGFPKILAKDLAKEMIEQGLQFGSGVVLDEEIGEVVREGDHLLLRGGKADYLTRTLVIAGGKGAFEPMPLRVPGYTELLHKGIEYAVQDPDVYEGKSVLVVGGGDSALDWSLMLKDRCDQVVLVHRREGFRAHELTVSQVETACAAGEMELRIFHEVREIRGNGAVESVTIFDNRTDADTTLEVDAVLTFLGFKPDLGPI